MSRYSQVISYINAWDEPTHMDMLFDYDCIAKSPILKYLRRKHQVALGRFKKKQKGIKPAEPKPFRFSNYPFCDEYEEKI